MISGKKMKNKLLKYLKQNSINI